MSEQQERWTEEELRALAEHIGLQKPPEPDKPEEPPGDGPVPGKDRNYVPREGYSPPVSRSRGGLQDFVDDLFGNSP